MTTTAPLAAQTHYQVRFARGIEGLQTVGAHADVVIWVDALPEPGEATAQKPAKRGHDAHAHGWPELVGVPIIHADLTTRTDAAKWMLEQQVEAGDRVSVAVVAASDGVEDTLAAGAVIDAMAGLGIDFSSPEAAVVCASFTGLERAVAHLFTASVAGRALIAQEGEDGARIVSDASGIDSQNSVVA
jgi:2-phosphosulfolactate phosphatase